MTTPRAVSTPAHRHVGAVLVVAILAVSTAGTLVRLAPDVHPLALAFWRVLLVGLLLLPGARPVPRREALLTALGGLFLALHFWTWFLSLRETTVLRSTLLVCLTPVWAALLEWGWLRTRPSLRFAVGIAIAVSGVGFLVSGGAPSDGTAGVTGDALAVLGGMLGAAYFTIGRSVRATVSIGQYGPLSCLATAAWLALLAALTDAPLTGFPPASWWAIAGLALGPQLLGHLGFNYAVGRLPAAIVTAIVLLEPVGAAGVAAIVLGEWPGPRDAVGAALTLGGVAFAVWPHRASSRRAS